MFPKLPVLTDNTIDDVVFTVEQVARYLHKLPNHNCNTPDLIPYAVLKNCADTISPVLTELYRLSLDSGQLPTLWKTSTVIPLHKKGKVNDPLNYRPISLTSVICRVFERILADSISEYLNSNNLFSPSQFGFIKSRSTNTQLLEMLEDFYDALTSKKSIDCVYIDYQKAFDKVPRYALLRKLESLGIREETFGLD